jgi:SHS2 domain-containing protein
VTRWQRPQPFEEIDHTADAGVTVRGDTREEALARLLLAFSELLTAGGPLVRSTQRSVSAEASDDAAMAVDLLRELLYVFESERLLPLSVEVARFDPDTGAEVLVELGPYDPELHAEGLVLKAVTLHEARFACESGVWEASVVFDV